MHRKIQHIIKNFKVKKVYSACLERWKYDWRVKIFKERFSTWISYFDEQTLDIALEMLKNFQYYDRETVNKLFIDYYRQLKQDDTIDLELSAFSVVKSLDGRANSSSEYVCEFKTAINCEQNVFNWIEDIRKFATIQKDDWDALENLILIDDCSGSGMTIEDFLGDNYDLLRNKRIIVLLIHYMKDAKLETLHNNLIVVSHNKFEKGLQIIHAGKQKDILKSKDLLSIHGMKYGLFQNECGFNDCQALIAFYKNTPDNTFPIFWDDTVRHKSIFPRKSKNKMDFAAKKNRQISNYRIAQKNG